VADHVIDANVWVQSSKKPAGVETLTELDCIDACMQWLQSFMDGDDRLVIDNGYEILKQYRRYIKQSDQRAYEWLNTLQRTQPNKLIKVQIEFDDDGYASIPFDFDPDDRKYIAVALAHDPTPPIVDATDTDWAEKQEILIQAGITVIELCPDYIAEKLK